MLCELVIIEFITDQSIMLTQGQRATIAPADIVSNFTLYSFDRGY